MTGPDDFANVQFDGFSWLLFLEAVSEPLLCLI